jgi:hypothetical protein
LFSWKDYDGFADGFDSIGLSTRSGMEQGRNAPVPYDESADRLFSALARKPLNINDFHSIFG